MQNYEDEVEKSPKKNRSLKVAFKKSLASRASDSRLGRKAILAVVGDEGDKVLKCITDVASIQSGKEKGKEVEKCILKFSLKAKILADEGILDVKSTIHAMDPINFLSRKLLEACEMPIEKLKRNKEVLSSLLGNFSRVRDIITELLEDAMKEKNVLKLKELLQYLGSMEFLSSLLMDERCVAQKTVLGKSLRELLKAELEELDNLRTFPRNPKC